MRLNVKDCRRLKMCPNIWSIKTLWQLQSIKSTGQRNKEKKRCIEGEENKWRNYGFSSHMQPKTDAELFKVEHEGESAIHV